MVAIFDKIIIFISRIEYLIIGSRRIKDNRAIVGAFCFGKQGGNVDYAARILGAGF